MENAVTKDDLRQFGMVLLNDIRQLMDNGGVQRDSLHPEWAQEQSGT